MKGKKWLLVAIPIWSMCLVGSMGYCLQDKTPQRPTTPQIEQLRHEIMTIQSDLFIVSERIKQFQMVDQQLRQAHAEKSKQLIALEKALEKTTDTLEMAK